MTTGDPQFIASRSCDCGATAFRLRADPTSLGSGESGQYGSLEAADLLHGSEPEIVTIVLCGSCGAFLSKADVGDEPTVADRRCAGAVKAR
jgi:hypothetical protein